MGRLDDAAGCWCRLLLQTRCLFNTKSVVAPIGTTMSAIAADSGSAGSSSIKSPGYDAYGKVLLDNVRGWRFRSGEACSVVAFAYRSS